jgi:hypothetical protein
MRWLYEEMLASQARERQRIVLEIAQIQGLFPVLMKPRNGLHWSREDKTLIRFHLYELAKFSPYLVPAVMPGGVFMLPVLAWWLDRRRGQPRVADASTKSL